MSAPQKSWIRWVERLARTDVGASCCNPYALNRTRANKIRRANLSYYLEERARFRPKFLLVGEALGHRGGRVTGIPFVSHHLLMTHPWYGADGYQPLPKAPLSGEATSTIMHTVLGDIALRPLLWNAFPFHPHKPNNQSSNRKPTAGELAIGRTFLQTLIERMEIETIVAVGNSAEKALTQLSIPHHKVRHPSHGGKRDFEAGLRQLTQQK